MTNSIIPPPDLVHNWCQQLKINGDRVDLLLVKAAQWGADQELEACCEWLVVGQWFAPDGECLKDLRVARRQKPLSLKEQALIAARIELIEGGKNAELILRALEALPND